MRVLPPAVVVGLLLCLGCASRPVSASPAPDGAAAATATTIATATTTTPAVGDPATAGARNIGLVRHIVDGDTLDVELSGAKVRIRLIGIDTPESVKPDSPVECFGVEASNHLKALLPIGTEVEVLRDAELSDPYDRLLGYVFRRSDGLFVNLSMATDGYANALTIPPNVTFADDVRAAVAEARRRGLGLWKACADPDALFS